MTTRILITGMAGFIGHHVAEGILSSTDWDVVGLDRLDTSGTLHRLTDIQSWETQKKRVTFVWHDLKAPINDYVRSKIGHVDLVLHLAASTHVDRSITQPMEFVMDNVVGTAHLLEYVRGLDPSRPKPFQGMIYFSTDEVFGPAAPGIAHKEWDNYHSGNPYAATKAAGEELCLAYQNTYKLPISITHCMNVFGERQHAEKFIPLVIRSVLLGEEVTIHSNATRTLAGSRFYIHARNVGAALLFVLETQKKMSWGRKYNIVGEKEIDNLEMAQAIARIVGKPLRHRMIDFHSSRPGHDLRYALDGDLLRSAGFELPKSFEESLEKTVRWFLEHPEWLGLNEATKPEIG